MATLLNYALAASVGVWLAQLITPQWLPWFTGAVLIGERLADHLPLKSIRSIAAGVFMLTGMVMILATLGLFTREGPAFLPRGVVLCW